MCGRATLTCPPEVLAEHFGVALPASLVLPRFNITPSQPMLVVRATRSGSPADREAVMARWGLVPHWAEDASIGARCAQARRETIAQSAAFRDAFRARRCLVAVDGYYEWRRAHPQQKKTGAATPHWVHRGDGAPFALAGVWERWTTPEGERVETCAVITTEARGDVAQLHHRMPVVVPRERFSAWLAASPTGASELLSQIAEESAEGLACRAVSPRVNRPEHDDAACLEPATADAPLAPEPQLTFRF
ncbi:MAG: SOS response-associated peptidase [Polyangiaceae bacterium]